MVILIPLQKALFNFVVSGVHQLRSFTAIQHTEDLL